MLTALPKFLAEMTVNPSGVKNLSDVRRATQADPREEFPARDTQTWDITLDRQGFGNEDPRALAALAENLRLGGEGGMLGAIERNRLDALVLPTGVSRSMAAIVGAPIVTVPMGYLPPDTPVEKNPGRIGLVLKGPNIP